MLTKTIIAFFVILFSACGNGGEIIDVPAEAAPQAQVLSTPVEKRPCVYGPLLSAPGSQTLEVSALDKNNPEDEYMVIPATPGDQNVFQWELFGSAGLPMGRISVHKETQYLSFYRCDHGSKGSRWNYIGDVVLPPEKAVRVTATRVRDSRTFQSFGDPKYFASGLVIDITISPVP